MVLARCLTLANAAIRLWTVIGGAAAAAMCAAPLAAPVSTPVPTDKIAIDAVPVALNPQDPSMTMVGEFRYAGGLALTSKQTDLVHELSDLVVTADDRVTAVGDAGVLLEARLLLNERGELVGLTDATLTRLIGENGKPLTGSRADAEGLALLADGDRLISFEQHPRILLYPQAGGLPHAVPSPRVRFPSNAGMEALTADDDGGYVVGGEDSGETWTCHVTSPCVSGPTIEKAREFGLVSIDRLPGGLTAYLLRAFDPVRKSRIVLEIVRGGAVVAHLDLAPPLSVDNFEGVTSVARPDGTLRFYLISDDNHQPAQRTLLMSFDWQPPR
jgi:hypothetical protein